MVIGAARHCIPLLAKNSGDKPSALAVKDQPNRAVLTDDEPLSLTWAELEAASSNLAAQFGALGLVEDEGRDCAAPQCG